MGVAKLMVHKPYRTRQAVDEVTEALKVRYREQQALVAVAKASREQNRNTSVPNKGTTKGAGPMSKGTINSYGANTFQTCPGGARDEARTGAYAAFLKQVSHPETGCIVVAPETKMGKATMRRLTRSALNANTTRR